MEKYKVNTDNLDIHDIYKGDIINEDGTFEWKGTYSMLACLKKAIELHPDWFEKVDEKDWEVWAYDLDNKIFQVKRLSDGEIFTVGDKVEFAPNPKYSFEIKEFFLRDDGILLARSKNCAAVEDVLTIQHAKESLYITTDGKNLYNGTACYIVWEKNWTMMPGVFQERDYQDSIKKGEIFKIFSDKENAEKYIEENKPPFSKKDTPLDWIEGWRSGTGHCNINKIEHVKEPESYYSCTELSGNTIRIESPKSLIASDAEDYRTYIIQEYNKWDKVSDKVITIEDWKKWMQIELQFSKKKPLLITEDGKKIYDKQNSEIIYFINIDRWILKGSTINNFFSMVIFNKIEKLKHYKIYSSENLAKDWFEENKPQFSREDMNAFAIQASLQWQFKDNNYNLDKWLKQRENTEK